MAGMGGSDYRKAEQRIVKINAGQGSDRRSMILTEMFLLQVREGAAKKLSRIVPLEYITSIEWDAQAADPKVLIRCKPGGEYLDWEFKFQNGGGSHASFPQFFEHLNRLRSAIPGATPETLTLQTGITGPAQSKKGPHTKSVKEIVATYPREYKAKRDAMAPPPQAPPVAQENFGPRGAPGGFNQQDPYGNSSYPPPPPDPATPYGGGPPGQGYGGDPYAGDPYGGDRYGGGAPPGYGDDPHGDGYGQEDLSSHPSDKYFQPLTGQPRQMYVTCFSDQENHKFKFAVRRPEEGVRIIDITPGGPYHRAGVPCGRLVSINNIPVASREDVTDQIQKLQSNGVTRFPVMVIPDPNLPSPPPYNPQDFASDNGSPGAAAPATPFKPPPYTQPGVGPETDDETTDEFLTRNLNRVARLHKNGEITDEQYRTTKAQILSHLTLSRDGPGGSPLGSPVRSTQLGAPGFDGVPGGFGGGGRNAPAHPWAETNIRRYIYLRVGPGRQYNWVANGGVFGVVKVLHTTDNWAFVRTDAGTEGYLRERYLNYLPAGPKSSRILKTLAEDRPYIPHSPDALSNFPSTSPPRGQGDDYFDPVSGRWVSPAARTISADRASPTGKRPMNEQELRDLAAWLSL